MLLNCFPYQLSLILQPVITGGWKPGKPGSWFPPWNVFASEQWMGSACIKCNLEMLLPLLKMMLCEHIKPDGCWWSVKAGVRVMWFGVNCWLLFCDILGLVSLLSMRCSWTSLVLRGTWLTTLESYLIKHCKTTLEVKTSLPLLPSLALTCLHMIIVILSLRHSS